MDADVRLSAETIDAQLLQGRTLVVIDVLRTSSTIVEALARGAGAVYPTANTDDAIKLASSLGREDTLLCGERKGIKIEGFDLGNSPREFTAEVVSDKRLVMDTGEGSRLLAASAGARRVLVASYLNLSAVADALTGEPELMVVCVGREHRFSLEDTVCAGMLLQRLGVEADGESVADGVRGALAVADLYAVDTDFLASTDEGRALAGKGMASDLELCARLDAYRLVPEMKDGAIRPRSDGA